MEKSKLHTILFAGTITVMAVSLITFPQDALEASKRGLDMWWGVVFPSLLPFFIVSEMLIGYGVVKFIGVLLEPLMRPLFRVPGIGGFVWAMGMASGFPAGAKITARLRQENQLTKIEAERLVTFTNASNPLFIFGAIAVGFFHNAELGIILALSHYLGNLCVGILMRFHGKNEEKHNDKPPKGVLLKEAFNALHYTRLNNNKPLGKILGDAVTSSIQTLLLIGGFIILFSVVNKLLELMNIIQLISGGLQWIFALILLPMDLTSPFISGLFEITLGSQLTSQTETNILQQIIITSFILGFSGFSVQAQVASIIAETDIRFKPYFIARIIHGFLAAFFTILLWKPLHMDYVTKLQTVPALGNKVGEQTFPYAYWEFLMNYGALITIGGLILYTLIYGYRTLSRKPI